MTVSFFAPGKPRGQARPRTTRSGHVYKAASSREYEAAARLIAQAACPEPLEGPLEVSVVAWFPRPKRLKGSNVVRHTSRPDVDNVAKSMLDAMNGVVYADDSQVARLVAEKWYAAAGGGEGVSVTVRRIEE